eukprot:11209339-Lingulodinium_polyedra.AAC.1
MDPESDAFRIGTALELETLEGAQGALSVVDAIIAAQRPRTMQEATKLFKGVFRLQRKHGESMQKWATRFKLQVGKTGRALHQSEDTIPADAFLRK